MDYEKAPQNADEQAAFEQATGNLNEELDEARKPTDGWDTVPRPNPVDELMPGEEPEHGRKYIPPGHIALQGDFVTDEPDR